MDRRKMFSMGNRATGHRQRGAVAGDGISSDVQIDESTDQPNVAWERLREEHPVLALSSVPEERIFPPKENHLRFVCMSDTHGRIESKKDFLDRVPNGDVLLHAGDFSMGGDPGEIMNFDGFMSRLPHPIKIVIAGNHELTFESAAGYGGGVHPLLARKKLGLPISSSDLEVEQACKALLQNILYLQDQALEICGLKIFGSPWVPEFGTWGFSLRRGYPLLKQWSQIPADTDILITHGPPLGYGDTCASGKHVGCVELLNTVVHRVKPKFHVFGHIHKGHGKWTDGKTVFINASICDDRYRTKNDPVVFDVPLPQGYTREDFKMVTMASLREQLATPVDSAQCKQSKTAHSANETVNCDDLTAKLTAVTL